MVAPLEPVYGGGTLTSSLLLLNTYGFSVSSISLC